MKGRKDLGGGGVLIVGMRGGIVGLIILIGKIVRV